MLVVVESVPNMSEQIWFWKKNKSMDYSTPNALLLVGGRFKHFLRSHTCCSSHFWWNDSFWLLFCFMVWNHHLDYSDTEEKTLALCSGFSSAKFQSFDCGQDVWKTTSSMIYEMYSYAWNPVIRIYCQREIHIVYSIRTTYYHSRTFSLTSSLNTHTTWRYRQDMLLTLLRINSTLVVRKKR